MGKHINQAKKPVSVLVTILLAFTGIVGFTQVAIAEPTPPELCVASQDEADFSAMISGSEVEIRTTGDLVRWSLSYDAFRNSDVVIRASELVLECVFPAIPVFEGTLNEEYATDASSISVVRFAGGLTASADRASEAVLGLGMFSHLQEASIFNLEIQGQIETSQSIVGSLAGSASETLVQNTSVTDMTMRFVDLDTTYSCSESAGCIGGLIGIGADNITLDTVRTSGDIEISRPDQGGVFKSVDFIGGAVGSLVSEGGAAIAVKLSDVHTDFDISITASRARHVGGLAGAAAYFGDLDASDSSSSGSIQIFAAEVPVSDDPGVTDRVGGLFGYLDQYGSSNGTSIISGSTNRSHITIEDNRTIGLVGGLVGDSSSAELEAITSFNEANLQITSADEVENVGGLVGYARASSLSIASSGNSGQLNISSNEVTAIGGLVGRFTDDEETHVLVVLDSFNAAPLLLEATLDVDRIGGLIGSINLSADEDSAATLTGNSHEGNLTISSNTRSVTGVGGLVGAIFIERRTNSATISRSYSAGEFALSALGSSAEQVVREVGGLVGRITGVNVEIQESFSQVSLIEGETNVGGLVGFLDTDDNGVRTHLRVSNSYASSAVSSTGLRGGLVGSVHTGEDYSAVFTATGFVWRYDNDESSDAPDVAVIAGGGDLASSFTASIVRASTSQMRTQSTFTDLGWDFESIWEMSGTDEWQCFPVLQWQEVTPNSSCGEARSLSVSRTTFTEAVANDGSITLTSVFTLTGDTFSGDNNRVLGSVTNVPAGLTASLVKTSDTTATLSFTGSATAHANAQDISNLTVTFLDGDFTGGNASGVRGFTTSNLVIDFTDPSSPPPGGGSSSPIMIIDPPPAAGLTEPVRAMVSGFAPNSSKLTRSKRIALRALVAANPAATSVSCRGFTSAPSTPQDSRLSRDRGKAICDFIVKLNPAISAKVLRGEHDNRAGQQVRRVRVVLR